MCRRPPRSPVASATAPEFQLVNETTVGGYLNFMQGVIERGLLIRNNVADIAADYRAELALVNDPVALVDHVCLVLAAGAVSAASKAIMVKALIDTPLPTTGTAANIDTARRRRVMAAIFMVMGCPEYLVQK